MMKDYVNCHDWLGSKYCFVNSISEMNVMPILDISSCFRSVLIQSTQCNGN